MLQVTITLNVARLDDVREMLAEIAGRMEDSSCWGGSNAAAGYGTNAEGKRSGYRFELSGGLPEKQFPWHSFVNQDGSPYQPTAEERARIESPHSDRQAWNAASSSDPTIDF